MNEQVKSVPGGRSLIKAILQALVILAVSAGLAQVFLFPLIQDRALGPLQQWEVEYLASGTMELLADQLNHLTPEARKDALMQLSPQFGFDIALSPLRTIGPGVQDLERLRRGEIVGDPTTYSAYKRLDDEDVLVFRRINVPAQHMATEAQRRHMGTLAMLERRLRERPANERETAIKAIADQFRYPVAIVALAETGLSAGELAELEAGRIVTTQTDQSISADYPAEMVYKKIGEDALTLGPFSPPTLQRFYPVVSTYYVIFGIVVLLPLAIWLIPTWRSMNQLSRATNAFGRGEFEVRAKPIRGSNANYLIDVFNRMADKIQSLVESNKSLINAVSHELRTPLSRIEFNIELARQSTDIAERNVQLDRIEGSVDELKTMVAELLQYARFDREKPNFKMASVDIAEWLTGERENWHQDAGDLAIGITTPQTSVTVSLERYYMSRAISNLIRNAVRFAESAIEVKAQIVGGNIEISVSDDGPGVDYQERTNIFQPFVRLDNSRNRESGGTGLGLAIVKQIIAWHSGNVWVEEAASGGAKFIVQWPCAEER